MAGFLAVGVANGEDRQLSLHVAGGLERAIDNLTLGASVAYSETGSAIALAVEDVDYASTQAFVGVRFDGVIERPNFVMRPALSVRGVMEVGGNENGVAAAFGTGGAPTTFFAASRDEEWGEVAGSVMFDGEGADLTLRAASMIGRDDVDYQTYTATVSMRF